MKALQKTVSVTSEPPRAVREAALSTRHLPKSVPRAGRPAAARDLLAAVDTVRHVDDESKYVVVERERRFLVKRIPTGVVEVRRITDRYLDGTRLRLRHTVAEDGAVTRKLGHKVRLAAGPEEIACTSIYLDDDEWALLQALPGRTLRKTRYIVCRDDVRLAVDELEDGTLLAEIDDGERDPQPPPGWLEVVQEVTVDESWTGGRLAI